MEVPGGRSHDLIEVPGRRSLCSIEVSDENSSDGLDCQENRSSSNKEVHRKRFVDVPGRMSSNNAIGYNVPSCDPCQAIQEYINASSYCIVCNEYLCLRCTKRHTNSKLSRSHKTLNQTEMPEKRLSSVNINICTKHDDMLKYYCRFHNNFCCSTCVTDGHAKCGVELIKELASDYENSEEYKSLRQNLARISGEFREIQQLLEESDTALKNSYDQVLAEIQRFRSEMNQRLDLLEKETLHRVKEMNYLIATERKSLHTDCNRILAELDKSVLSLDEQEIYSQYELLFISALCAEKYLKTNENKIKMISTKAGKNIKKKHHFSKNGELEQVLKSIDMLGKIEVCGGMMSAESAGGVVINEGQINVKSPEDKTDCWITGCVDLGEEYVAIADHNNSCVKILDMQTHELVEHVRLPVKPWDIARARDRHLIVSCDDKLVLMKLSRRPALTIGSTVSVPGACSGVMQGWDNLVVSVVNPAPLVHVMTSECRLEHTIPTDKTQQMFTSPFYVMTGTKKQDIFITDYDKDIVMCITSMEELKQPMKILV